MNFEYKDILKNSAFIISASATGCLVAAMIIFTVRFISKF